MFLNCGAGEDSWEAQSILTEISPGCSLEGLTLKLKLQYFGHIMEELTHWKDSDAGRDWGQEEKGMTEDEMAGWHHWLHGHEFEWTLGVGDGQGGLACCDSWGRKESDTTEQLNWTELKKERWEQKWTLLQAASGWKRSTHLDLEDWLESGEKIKKLHPCITLTSRWSMNENYLSWE